jgi:FKBP-type peptidyl-prolyl cis-trans isomerase SlyD
MSTDVITTGKVVGFHYTLRNDAGEILDSSNGAEPLHYLHGGGNIVPGLENALHGKSAGESLKVTVAPGDGYGERHEAGVHRVPRDQFPPNVQIEVGMQFGTEGPDGEAVPVWVAAVDADAVTIDFNHPLAGQSLHFDVQLISVRDATDEEKAHGHPHGPGGHHHH